MSVPPAGIIEFLDVSKFYGDVLGVMDVGFTIEPGVTGLLGPNGAGKSTLIKLATGLLCPDQGDVRIDGRSVWGNLRLGFDLGYVTDLDALPEFMTGQGFVAHLLGFQGGGRRDAARRAAAALERLDLASVAGRKIHTYSKGMRQRLKLAQAVAHDPGILILDEPLTGLDPVGRRAVMNLIRELSDADRTILVSSHILHEVESVTDRVAMIHHGRLLAHGRIPDLRSGLLEHPYRVRVVTDDARTLATRLLSCTVVDGVQLEDDTTVVAVTSAPDGVIDFLTRAVAEEHARVHELDVEDEDLEAVFRYAVDR